MGDVIEFDQKKSVDKAEDSEPEPAEETAARLSKQSGLKIRELKEQLIKYGKEEG